MIRAARRLGIALIVACFAATAATAHAPGAHYRWAKRVKAAKRFADGRAGRISFAIVDEEGRMHAAHPDRVHNSASVVKVLFMIALLREPGVRHDDLTASEKALLEPMIQRSDNDAATAVFNRVGAAALYRLADEIGLDHFSTQPTWGLTTITAGSQARFFSRIQRYIPKRHRVYAMRLLTQIVPAQRWGIPPAAPAHWKLYFKGGWSGAPSWRVNQVMLLRRPPRRLAVAILTREQPSFTYGTESIEGVAERLLDDYNAVSHRSAAAALPRSWL
jgi:beta-lactamase class A